MTHAWLFFQWITCAAAYDFVAVFAVYCWLWSINPSLAIKCKRRGHAGILPADIAVSAAFLLALQYSGIAWAPWAGLGVILFVYPIALLARIKNTAWPEPIMPPSNLAITRIERRRAQQEREARQQIKSHSFFATR